MKRLYIPLPDLEARKSLVVSLLNRGVSHSLAPEDMYTVAQDTEGYSGADIHSLCTEAALIPTRGMKNIHLIDSAEVRPIR